jgi:tetratricopeptide (TPR) repeat protein
MSVVYTAQGQYQEALEAGLRADERFGSVYDQQIGFVGFLYGRLGRREEALQQLDRLEVLAADGGWVSPMARARVYAGLGEVDEAMAWLERAWEEGSHWLIWLGWEPWYWESLASDPRFHALVDRMGYPSTFARRVLAPDPS